MSTSPHQKKSAAPSSDDLMMHLERLLAGSGVAPSDTGGSISFAGADPLFPSAVPLASAFALSAMAAAVGAAALWRL